MYSTVHWPLSDFNVHCASYAQRRIELFQVESIFFAVVEVSKRERRLCLDRAQTGVRVPMQEGTRRPCHSAVPSPPRLLHLRKHIVIVFYSWAD